MRNLRPGVIAICALGTLSLLVPGAVAQDGGLPVRRAGQWELTTISAATGTIVSRVCITEKDSILTPSSRTGCVQPMVRRAGDQTIVDLVCEDADAREHISALFTGDFQSWYRAIVKMTFEGKGASPNLGVTIEGKFISSGC